MRVGIGSTHVEEVMMQSNGLYRIASLSLIGAVALLLSACRGGDAGDAVETSFPLTPDPDAFAVFLNTAPGVPREGAGFGEIDNVEDFPGAYYNTIDPDDTRDSFFKWRLANGFINADGSDADCPAASCVQTHVKFRDTRDLGYGRNMFMRRNTVTGDIAVYVENFQVDSVPGVPYGPLNFEALVDDERQWNFGVNAIEFSAFPATDAGARKFTKFYNFDGEGKRDAGTAGSLQHFVDLDDRGEKAMPGACIVCHGGRGRTLVVEDTQGRKTLAPTVIGGIAGDVQAQLQTIELDTLQFANESGFRREDNEDGIRLINEAVLDSYLYRDEHFTGTGDWDPQQAIQTLRGRLDNDLPSYDETFVPAGWQANQNLYRTLVSPNCLVCHVLQGTRASDSIDFASLNAFSDYAERIDHLVFEQGKMPAGLLNYADFWESENKDPATLATALGLDDRVDGQTAIRPGDPVAQISAPPVATGVATDGSSLDIAITGSGSAFARADSHRWQVTPSASASILADGPAGDARLRVTLPGSYTLTLTVDGSHGGNDTVSQSIRVLSAADADAPLPGQELQFFGTDGIEAMTRENCLACHTADTSQSSLPIHFTACRSDEFNGNEFLYRSVLARVNFDSPMDSLFLRKPVGGATDPLDLAGSRISDYHAGGSLLTQTQYSTVLSWILNGAPSGTIPAADSVPPDAPACLP